jgi:hypothetical protein
LTPRQRDNLELFARGAVTAIPQARENVAALLATVDRLTAELAAARAPK